MAKQYQLTPIQQGMLLHTSMSPNSGVDVLQEVIDFHEPLNIEAFIAAWRSVVKRHDVFRSSFHWGESNNPFQLFEDDVHLELTEKNLSGSNNQEQRVGIRQYLESDRLRGFDMAKPPLMRLAILKLAKDTYSCILTFHHIIIDGYSIELILKEFSALYDAKVNPALLPTTIPFRKYLVFLEERSHDESKAWWNQLLSGIESATSLISNKSERDKKSGGIASQWINFDDNELQLLQDFIGKNFQISWGLLFMAGWAQVLHRYSGKDDVIFGYIRACRNGQLDDIQDIVGLLLNTVLFRSSCHAETNTSDYLTQVRAQMSEVRPHERTPLFKVRKWSDIKGDGPLFESLIVIQPYEKRNFFNLKEPENPWLSRKVWHESMPGNPITLNCYSGDTVDIEAVYDTSLFSESIIQQVLQNFKTILLSLCKSLNEPAFSLSMMQDGEKEQILRQWNDTQAVIPDINGVHAFFEKQSELNPELIAVTDGNNALTYSETNFRSNALAAIIRKAGALPDMPIGILMERSIELPIAVLGVLKSGSAYVPLDPAYPEDRLAYMIEKAGIRVILSTNSMCDHPCIQSEEVICVDNLEKEQSQRVSPQSDQQRHNLAYIKFTSGSTGKPKAVAMTHSPLINLISWQLEHSDCGIGTNTLQFAALSFDVSFQEMFSTWAAGGTLVLVADDTRRDLVELTRYIEEKNIHRLFLPFVMLQELANAATVLSVFPSSLREVITAGEQLQVTSSITAFFEKLQDCRLVNQYGPTESHVVSFYELDHNREDWEALPPIGRPINNTRLYILDAQMNPVPAGVPGELFIAGTCLANGYFNEPKLTSERFLDVIPKIDPESKLYRTGDLCRFRHDGVIDYLGRIDQQVKVRGFRVELSEIEAVIRRHPIVTEVVVDARGSGRQSKKLISYIIRDTENTSQNNDDIAESLREWLRNELPDYMVPSAFIFVESFAKTPSGKLDRRALPDPEFAKHNREFVQPSTETEKRLVVMWSEILDLETISIRESFFDAGGDSLAAAVLFIGIKMSFSKELPVSTLYKKRTIEVLAAAIDTHSSDTKASALVAMQSEGTRNPVFLVHGGWGSILHLRNLVELMGKNQPCYGFEAPDAETSPLYQTVEERAAAYLVELLEFQPQGPYQLGGYCMGGVIALEMARQLRAQGRQVNLLLLIDCFAPGYELHTDSPRNGRILNSLKQLMLNVRNNIIIQKTLKNSATQNVWRVMKKLVKYNVRDTEESAAAVDIQGRYAFFNSNKDAIASYKADSFRGNVHIFRSQLDQTSRNLGWGNVFYGEEKIYSIPGDHTESLYPPNVDQWALQLSELLSKSATVTSPKA